IATAKPDESVSHDVEQQPLARAIVLHLLPGAIGTVVYVASIPLIRGMGFPLLLAAYLILTSVIILFELGYLLYQGNLKNGVPSLQGIVLYRERLPIWQYLALVPLLLIWGIVLTALAFPIDDLLSRTLFSWLPDWYLFKDVPQYSTLYPRQALLIT